jgi:RNA polymerase sigma factor (TIGR02999 family)
MGAAARAMRRILVEHARQRSAKKRGSNAKRVTFADVQVQTENPQVDILALDEALSSLKEMDQRLVKVVELRYFAGCSLEEAAKVLGVSAATVKRDWTYARAWLMEYMSR